MGIQIKDEDVIMLTYLFQSSCHFLTFDQIHENIYPNLTLAGFKSKMRRFKKWDIILTATIDIADIKNQRVAFPSAKALKYFKGIRLRLMRIEKNKNAKLKYIDPIFLKSKYFFDAKQLEHDFVINELRFKLEKNGFDNWIEGNIAYRKYAYKDYYDKIADAYIEANDKYKIALEYEHNLKNKNTYKKIFKRYEKEEQLDYVIYICANNTVYNSIKKLMTEDNISDTNKFWLTKKEYFFNDNFEIFNNIIEEPFNYDNLTHLLHS